MWIFVHFLKKFDEKEFLAIAKSLGLVKRYGYYEGYCPTCFFRAILTGLDEIEFQKRRNRAGLGGITACHNIFRISEQFAKAYSTRVKVDASLELFSYEDKSVVEDAIMSIERKYEKRLKEIADYAKIKATLIKIYNATTGYIDIYAELRPEMLSKLFELIEDMYAEPAPVAEVI